MKIKVSIVYLVLYVLGIIAAGVLTGIYGNDISIWISYGFLVVYGIMILINATITERVANIKIESSKEPDQLTPQQIKDLPSKLGEGEEKKVGETTLETRDTPLPPIPQPPLPPPEIKEEGRKLTEAELEVVEKIAKYIKLNLEKGHKLETIRAPLDKAYGAKAVDWVLQNAIKVAEPELPDLGDPELPDLGEPEEIVTPKTLNKDIKKQSKDKIKCDKCGKTFKAEGYLKNHIRLSKKCQS